MSPPESGGLLMAEVTIEATPNGPYLVTGPIELRDAEEGLTYQGQGLALPLRRVDEEAVLRRYPLQDRLPGRGAGRAGIGRGGLSVGGSTTARRGTHWG